MKDISISKEQARVFAVGFNFGEINQYIADQRSEYEIWLAKETANKQQQKVTPIKHITMRKGAVI